MNLGDGVMILSDSSIKFPVSSFASLHNALSLTVSLATQLLYIVVRY